MISISEILSGYNINTIIIIYILVCIGPLPIAGSLPVFVAFALSCFRLFKYGPKSYVVDMVILLPLSNIYKIAPATPSVYLYLLLLGGFILGIRKKIKIRGALVFAGFYFLVMSGFVMDSYVSIMAALVFVAIYASNMTRDWIIKVSVFFSISVALSTLWALLFKDLGYFDPYILGEMRLSRDLDVLRFKGLFVDPNYFGTFLLLAITIIFQLYLCGIISLKRLLVLVSVDIFAGLLTLSKSFLLTIIALLIILDFFVWRNKKKSTALGVTIALIACGFFAFLGNFSPVSLILGRFKGQTEMNEITTGRYELWERYYESITASVDKILIGNGLDAPLLIQGSHNLYLEILYFVGIVGLGIIMALFYSYFKPLFSQVIHHHNVEKFISLLPCVCFFVLYWSLQGMFSFTTYVQLCIVISMCVLPITDKKRL